MTNSYSNEKDEEAKGDDVSKMLPPWPNITSRRVIVVSYRRSKFIHSKKKS